MNHPIFSSTHYRSRDDLCFVLMPFSSEFDHIYEEIATTVRTYSGLQCIRSDDVAMPERITDRVWQHINQARFLIADLTGLNANVFYELGLSHAIGKTVLLLVQDGTKVPFDLQGIGYHTYNSENLSEQLRRGIKGCLEWAPNGFSTPYRTENSDVRVIPLQAPPRARVGERIVIKLQAKNFGLDAEQAYFSLSFPSEVGGGIDLESDLDHKVHPPGTKLRNDEVILSYPMAQASLYSAFPSARQKWASKQVHFLQVEFTTIKEGLFRYYFAASSKCAGHPFVFDPPVSPIMDQRDEPVYCQTIEVFKG